jgi:transmembrane sensor
MTDSREPLQRLAELRDQLDPGLSDRDVERLIRTARERRQRARSKRLLVLGVASGALCTALAVVTARWLAPNTGSGAALLGSARSPAAAASASALGLASSTAALAPAPIPAARQWLLGDQSRATAVEPATELSVEEDTPERVRTRLTRGRARFEVAPRSERSFSVHAGNVTVSVVGTVFSVEVVADRVGVWVERGVVNVDWGLGHQRLSAAEGGWFPPLVLGGKVNDLAADGAAQREKPRTVPGPGDAQPGNPALHATASAQELLAEVDTARSHGQPERGVELLRQILREHPADPRAPLAAFTLGRVLLTELGRPREAAAAFREVQTRAPRSPFAEDALSREAEAWGQAGELGRARQLARSYLERYPAGRHVRKMKVLAGFE